MAAIQNNDADPPDAIAAVGLTKRYGALLANNTVDLHVRPGEVHALLGENGSGKTTLLSMLYGLIRPDSGEILVAGRRMSWNHRHHARDHGIGMVPQRFFLVPTLSVAENIALSVRKRAPHWRTMREVTERIVSLREQFGLSLDPEAVVGKLSIGERQRVEIARALYFDPDVILLDEPTSVLTPGEADALYEAIRELVRVHRRSVVLTTHRIREVFEIADRVTVLRGGEKIVTFADGELSQSELVKSMIGHRELPSVPRSVSTVRDQPSLLRAQAISLHPDDARNSGVAPVHKVSFEVMAGEVFGIAGVEGNGQVALEMMLAGILAPSSGSIEVGHNARTDKSVALPHSKRRGAVGYIPSERERFGVVPSLSVRDNLLLRELAEARLLEGAPSGAGSDERVAAMVREFSIEPPSSSILVRHLSGGNAQKVILARELSRGPQVTIAAQPTAGLDVAAAAAVRARLHEQSRKGRCVVIISSDLDELVELCDRISVMYHGRLLGSWVRDGFDRQEIGTAMAGAFAP